MNMEGLSASSVCVIGSYAKALVVTADRIPTPGETLVGWDYRQTFGGKGSDMAVQAARLGASVEYVGVVGNDAFGVEFTELLDAEGVSRGGLRVTDAQPTGVGLIIKDTAGRNVIVIDKGANGEFSEEDVVANRARIAGASVVLAQLEIPLDTALRALADAKTGGATTILNPAPAIDLTALGRRIDLSQVDVLTPNQGEARVLVGEGPESTIPNDEVVRLLRRRGASTIVITRGEDGVDVFAGDDYVHVPALPVEVVDSNGAGDSFNAGLAVALAEGRTLTEAVRFANATAALCCTGWETVPSYKHRIDVDAVLAASSSKG